MSVRFVVVAVALIALGIVFGITLVSSFKGVDLTFAEQDVKIGAQHQAPKAHSALTALNEAIQAIAREVTPSVVYIEVISRAKSDSRNDANRFFHFFGPDFRFEMPRPERGAGSGVILTPDGYILTNNHVVENAQEIEVTLSDNRKFKGARLVGTDRYTDLAVIKIDASNLTVAHIGNSDQVEVGHIVFAFGNPLGLTSTMTQGIISATGRGGLGIINDERGYSIENFIQSDAAVNPGNSGGPLVNINSEVIGINTAIATTNQRYQGYSFAIPINLAKKVATDLIRYGKVRRGYIGVQIQGMDATMAKANGFEKPTGVFIQEVTKGSAGEEAGLQPGDIILSVDGKEVNSANQLQTLVASKYPGDVVTLKVFRKGKTFDRKVTLKARDDDEEVIPARDAPRDRSDRRDASAPQKLKLENIGITIRNLDSKTKTDYKVDNGVLVESVEPLSEAQRRDLRPNDVILSVGDEAVNSVAEFESLIKSKKPGDAVLMRVKSENGITRFVAIEIPVSKSNN
jgi:serine protease Do